MRREIGLLIREMRLARGIGVNEFGEATGLDSGNYSRFEKGGGGLKLPDSLYPIARALNTSVPVIFIMLEKVRRDKSILTNSAKLVQIMDRVNEALEKI